MQAPDSSAAMMLSFTRIRVVASLPVVPRITAALVTFCALPILPSHNNK